MNVILKGNTSSFNIVYMIVFVFVMFNIIYMYLKIIKKKTFNQVPKELLSLQGHRGPNNGERGGGMESLKIGHLYSVHLPTGAVHLRGLTLRLRGRILHLRGYTHDKCADFFTYNILTFLYLQHSYICANYMFLNIFGIFMVCYTNVVFISIDATTCIDVRASLVFVDYAYGINMKTTCHTC